MKTSRRRRHKNAALRDLGFESLESRRLLAITDIMTDIPHDAVVVGLGASNSNHCFKVRDVSNDRNDGILFNTDKRRPNFRVDVRLGGSVGANCDPAGNGLPTHFYQVRVLNASDGDALVGETAILPKLTSSVNLQVPINQRDLRFGENKLEFQFLNFGFGQAPLPAPLGGAATLDTITVAVNQAPTTRPQTITLEEDQEIEFALDANDPDDDALEVRITQRNIPTGATLTVNGSEVTFIPAQDEFGENYASFEYQVSDGRELSSQSVVTFNVSPKNDAPRFAEEILDFTIVQGESLLIDALLGVVDPENDVPLTIASPIEQPPGSGKVEIIGDLGSEKIRYTPEPDFTGDDVFRYRVLDSLGAQSELRTVAIGAIQRARILTFTDDVDPKSGRQQFVVNQAFSNDHTPTLHGIAEAGSTVSLIVDGVETTLAVTTDANGEWSLPIPDDLLLEGKNRLQVTAVVGGLQSDSTVVDYFVDRTLPIATVGQVDNILNGPLSEDASISVNFQGGGMPDPVTGFAETDLILRLQSSPPLEISLLEADLVPNDSSDVDGVAFASSWSLRNLRDETTNTGSYALILDSSEAGILDRAANEPLEDAIEFFTVDTIAPVVDSTVLLDNSFPNSKLPVPVTNEPRPQFTIQVSDQQFAFRDNRLSLQLFAVTDANIDGDPEETPLLDEPLEFTIPAGEFDNLTFDQTIEVKLDRSLDPQSDHVIISRVTDAAGNAGDSPTSTLFVLDPGASTIGAPGTPAFTELTYIGATVLAPNLRAVNLNLNGDQIVVDQAIPVGFAVNVGGSSFAVTSSDFDESSGTTLLTLNRDINAEVGAKVSWLRPWQMSFDKTTQTVWFTMEDGHHVGQFDPSTGSVELFDVSIPSEVKRDSNGDPIRDEDGRLVPADDAMPTAVDPHGVFFDFNTHLTPRIWFVYRNQQAPELPQAELDEVLRVSYFDLDSRKLFTFDFEDVANDVPVDGSGDTGSETGGGSGGGNGSGGGGGNGSGGASSDDATETSSSSADDQSRALKVGHAVFVDAKGTVWITAQESGAIVELNFDDPPKRGASEVTLDGNKAQLIVHTVPKVFGVDNDNVPDDAVESAIDFLPHGVQTVVDERGDAPFGARSYVWMVNGSKRISSFPDDDQQRIALLIPGADRSEQDQWFEVTIDRLADGLAHLLFTAFDDNETPGIPEDDRLIFTDPGFNFTRGGADGIVVSVEVGPLVRAIQSGVKADQPARLQEIELDVERVVLPKIPGAGASDALAGPNQAFVDRSGTIFAVDPQGAIERFRIPELARLSGSPPLTARVTGTLDQSQRASIELAEAATSSFRVQHSFDSDNVIGSDPSRSIDRSTLAGLDQYEVSFQPIRTNVGHGPFRGALNAANVLYGSLSQSDHITTTVFAESARRQMAVVPSPFESNALVEARMAFQARRDGSLTLIARGDGVISDEVIDLTRTLLAASDRPDLNGFTFDQLAIAGDAAANVEDDPEASEFGSVAVLARTRTGGLVQFHFTPVGSAWQHADLFNTDLWSIRVWEGSDLPKSGNEPPDSNPILAEDPVNAESLGFTVTTAEGHLLAVPISGTAIRDLTDGLGDAARVFSGTATINVDNGAVVYGTNQTGNVIRYHVQNGTVTADTLVAEDRDVRLMQNLEVLALADDRSHHLFGVDGVSRLVHWEIQDDGTVRQQNVSKETANPQQAFGYFPFQLPFTGRVYTYVEPVVDANGRIRVYGTNGGDLVEFTRGPAGQWRVGNLTQNLNSTLGNNAPRYEIDPDTPPEIRDRIPQDFVGQLIRNPGNAVFGAPGAYRDSNGGIHVLQINAEGEIVEYYTFGAGLFPDDFMEANRFRTQNITFFDDLRQDPPPPDESDTQVTTGDSNAGPIEKEDVNRDGRISAQDALIIINRLTNHHAEGELGSNSISSYDLDVNEDGRLSASDALRVINRLARTDVEGESIGFELDDTEKWEFAVDRVIGDLDRGQLF